MITCEHGHNFVEVAALGGPLHSLWLCTKCGSLLTVYEENGKPALIVEPVVKEA